MLGSVNRCVSKNRLKNLHLFRRFIQNTAIVSTMTLKTGNTNSSCSVLVQQDHTNVQNWFKMSQEPWLASVRLQAVSALQIHGHWTFHIFCCSDEFIRIHDQIKSNRIYTNHEATNHPQQHDKLCLCASSRRINDPNKELNIKKKSAVRPLIKPRCPLSGVPPGPAIEEHVNQTKSHNHASSSFLNTAAISAKC